MCKLRYIHRVEGLVKKDQDIKMANREFDLVDRPYYIIRDDDADSVKFTFHYLDVTEPEKKLSDGYFLLTYGEETGRLFSLSLRLEGQRIKQEDWARFRKRISTDNTFYLQKKLQNSYDIIQRIYFERYDEVEESVSENSSNKFQYNEG